MVKELLQKVHSVALLSRAPPQEEQRMTLAFLIASG
jgi:hypothetical protein